MESLTSGDVMWQCHGNNGKQQQKMMNNMV